MNQSAYYKTAIDIVSDVWLGKLNSKEIIQQIAKISPKTLCDACQTTPWELEAKLILAREGKVPAIKFVRTATGLGLKEAKDVVDKWG